MTVWVGGALLIASLANASGDPILCFTSWRLGFSGAFFAPLDDLLAARAVPGQPRWTLTPTISPDGSRIAYSTEKAICIHEIATGETERMTEPGVYPMFPEWSPNGRHLAFWSSSIVPGDAGFWVLDIDTRDIVAVLPWWRVTRPTWSPRGDALAYEVDGDIFIVDVITGDQRPAIVNENAQDRYPSWSPDGGRFAFTSDRDGPRDVYAEDLDGRNVRRLTKMGGVAWPRWTPDGREVVFSASRGGNADIYIVDTEGGAPRRLTQHPSSDWYPSLFAPAALPVALRHIALTRWASLRRGQ
jgi:Tol biopolymer transport system component